jgi:hypothetical protein
MAYVYASAPPSENVLLPVDALDSPSCVKPLHNAAADDSVDDSDSGLISLRLRSSNTLMYCLSEGSRKRRA